MMDEMQGMPQAQGQMPPAMPPEQMQGGGDMPADQAQEQGGQMPPRRREDILGEMDSEREYLEKELAKQLTKIVENPDSVKGLDSSLRNLEDLFFENKEEFFKRILDFVGDEMESRLGSKGNELMDFDKEEAFQNQLGAFEQAVDAFAQANPNVDIQELLVFYTTLPQNVQKQLDSLPPQVMVQRLFEIYQAQTQEQGGEPNQDELPQQLNGMPAQTSELEPELDLPTSRY